MLKNKRGLSEVIVTVLLILITIAAFILIANVLVPFVKNSLPKSSECLPYKDYFKFEESLDYLGDKYYYNCMDAGAYGISVRGEGYSRGNVTAPLGFAVVFANGPERKSIEFKEGNVKTWNIRMLNNSTAIIKIPEIGGVQTYVYNESILGYTDMKINPILPSGRTCDSSDSIKINICKPNINLSFQ